MMRKLLLATAAFAWAASLPAHAAVVSVTPAASLTTTPLVVAFGGGVASLSFTIADASGFPDAGAAVATAGTAQVTSFFGSVTDFFSGSPIDGTMLYGFSAFSTAASIPNSIADDFIGFSYSATDGTHYGYAEVFGPTLASYGYETAPNTTILTGAVGRATTSVPEPASMALLAMGLGTLAIGRRFSRRL